MNRLIDWHLKRWKEDVRRKPLLLRGARQVGKSYAIQKLGSTFESFVEVNFENLKEAKRIFEKDLDPVRIIQEIYLLTDKKVTPGKTLLFFDEIQQIPEAITSLRYFYEQMPNLHIAAAGSLLDFALEKVGIPVGRVTNLFMYPLSFIEFLAALGHSSLIEPLLSYDCNRPLPNLIHERLLNLCGKYMALGGMPEVVKTWVALGDPKKCFEAQQDLIVAYQQDFEKYAKKHQEKYLNALFIQIPHFVSQQFQYKNIHGEYRKRELAPCLDLLNKANVIHTIYHSSGNGIPLGAGINLEQFKLIFLDVALSQSILGLNLSNWFLNPDNEFINKGSVVEAFVGQELLCYAVPFKKSALYFWKRDAKSSQAEVDYLVDYKNAVIPIEVKSGKTGHMKSLHLFLEQHPKSPFGIRFSCQNGSVFDRLESRPIYAVCSLFSGDDLESAQALA